jgi:hypothetical protein
VYRDAALAVLHGQDPWSLSTNRVAFAGPPPTLLLVLPLAFVPLPLAIGLTTVVLVAAAWWSIRRLGLPLWWLLFPPISESLIAGNPDVLVLAFLLVRGPLAGLAVVAKVYAVIPLLLQRRWKALLLAAGISGLTLPLWPMFIRGMPVVMETLDAQAQGFSAWGSWFLIPTTIALWSLRHRGAEWLVVPALWPDTQTHYAAMSVPAVRRYPLAAAIIGIGVSLAPPLAVVVMAIQERWRRTTTNRDRQSQP